MRRPPRIAEVIGAPHTWQRSQGENSIGALAAARQSTLATGSLALATLFFPRGHGIRAPPKVSLGPS
jgi:hypothetical protein